MRAAIAEAQREPADAHAYWDRVAEVRLLPPGELWGHMELLANEPDPRLRALVPDVLRGAGAGERGWSDRVVPLLADMLRRERAVVVLTSIADAFVDLRHPAELALLQPLTHHPEPAVRRAAISGLRDLGAVPDLIRLCDDVDEAVRSWATFTLGSVVDGDTPELRDALVRRLDDDHDETRAEAVLGLASRGDRRALPVILRELRAHSEWSHHLEAAALLADPSLYDALLAYEGTPQLAPLVERARRACSPAPAGA